MKLLLELESKEERSGSTGKQIRWIVTVNTHKTRLTGCKRRATSVKNVFLHGVYDYGP